MYSIRPTSLDPGDCMKRDPGSAGESHSLWVSGFHPLPNLFIRILLLPHISAHPISPAQHLMRVLTGDWVLSFCAWVGPHWAVMGITCPTVLRGWRSLHPTPAHTTPPVCVGMDSRDVLYIRSGWEDDEEKEKRRRRTPAPGDSV